VLKSVAALHHAWIAAPCFPFYRNVGFHDIRRGTQHCAVIIAVLIKDDLAAPEGEKESAALKRKTAKS
jgi:hypothetical protein